MHANEGVEDGWWGVRRGQGDECLSSDKAVCISLLSEKQREGEEDSSVTDFWKTVDKSERTQTQWICGVN